MKPTEERTRIDVTVRGLQPADLERVILLDAKNTGRRRDEYFKIKLRQNLAETGIKVSLAAEIDHMFAGFLLAREGGIALSSERLLTNPVQFEARVL